MIPRFHRNVLIGVGSASALLWAALGPSVVGCSAPRSQDVASAPRPNIIFVFADDHAYQAIGAYGSRINETPSIDRLAREGMLFQRAYVTNSICGPMRAVIQTGKYSHLNGFLVNGNQFDGTQQTFPKLLQKIGYQTAIIGKWHLGEHMAPQGYDYSEVLIGQGPYYNPSMLRNGERVEHEGYTTDIITDLALEWLKEDRDPDRPFMLMYQHKAPHRNWQPGPNHLHLFDDVTIPEPETLFDDYAGRGTPAHTQDMTIAKTMTPYDLKLTPQRDLNAEQLEVWNAAYEPKNADFRAANLEGNDLVHWKYQRYIKDYLRCVASVDDNLGRVLDYLDETGLAANTIVIYSSDQGFYLGEHGWFDKRWIYEESLRTPLIVRWPGVVEPGSVNHDIVSPLDFAETFLDVAGAEIPGDMQGRSLVPVLRGETPADWRKSFYYHYYEFPGWHDVRRHYGVTDGRHKLIHFYEPDVDEWELYDLEADPREMSSVYGDARYADVQQSLLDELARLREQYQVPEQDPPASLGGGRDNPTSVRIRAREEETEPKP
jgi:arylsulfatase A-like enzyme